MKIFPNFNAAIRWTGEQLRNSSYEVRGTRWQSTDVSAKPEMRMREVLNISFQVSLAWNENPQVWQGDIQPNMPWAEDHFQERVCGRPLNPGEQWRNWPWALAADRHRTESGGQFSHTYMERYWPKRAGQFDGGELPDADFFNEPNGYLRGRTEHHGIRYDYGDLNDVVNHLLADPLSRQAYLPVWFPEDTGVVHGERVPCTLGYHFIQRNGYLHSTYYIRSCDFYRHFRDDLYLSIRLQLWFLQQLREREEPDGECFAPKFWQGVKMGLFTFHCVSLHCFVNDWNKLFGAQK